MISGGVVAGAQAVKQTSLKDGSRGIDHRWVSFLEEEERNKMVVMVYIETIGGGWKILSLKVTHFKDCYF